MPHDLPAESDQARADQVPALRGAGATMCRIMGRKPSPFIVALCDRCSDHFLMLDCRAADLDVLKAEAQSRLDEVEQMRQKYGGGWRKRSANRCLP